MTQDVLTQPASERAMAVLRRSGNPFRNYFARNPDDEVCARYHVPELYQTEREQLLAVVDLFRHDPTTHSEVIPVLGNKGAGKTHLLHSIKHGVEGTTQLLVTPGVYQKDADFLEYLLFQILDTLLGGGRQKGTRPLEFVGERLVCRLMQRALTALTPQERLDLFPAPLFARWSRKLGLGSRQVQERVRCLLDSLSEISGPAPVGTVLRACAEAQLEPERACGFLAENAARTEPHNTAGLMRRAVHHGFARAVLQGDETELANFLTYGFAELDFQVRPSRQDLVLALFKVLMEVFLGLRIPVVVAFDQLEDLLLARRIDDGRQVAEAFFAGIVQVMHQIDGICLVIFAERGLWNRFVPSLDGYIQDRLNNPVHVPGHGTIKTLRLEAPPAELVCRVVEARLRPLREELADCADLPPFFPFTEEQVLRVARTEPTLRDMLQQYRRLFDHIVYGSDAQDVDTVGRQSAGEEVPVVKSVMMVETPPDVHVEPGVAPSARAIQVAASALTPPVAMTSEIRKTLDELWEQEMRAARRKLEPEGALTGATRELQAGLGQFLQTAHEHGVKVGPWRLQHVVPEWAFGEHPTYGAITLTHWACKDGQPWKLGVGLFLGRGPGKPRDLETKLSALEITPPMADYLILLRPEDDPAITGKSKQLWQEAEKRGRHARLELVSLDAFAVLYGFPRWLSAVAEALPDGQPLPNLADLMQEKCERLLQQVCLPVQGG
jgi:hypothetical protein